VQESRRVQRRRRQLNRAARHTWRANCPSPATRIRTCSGWRVRTSSWKVRTSRNPDTCSTPWLARWPLTTTADRSAASRHSAICSSTVRSSSKFRVSPARLLCLVFLSVAFDYLFSHVQVTQRIVNGFGWNFHVRVDRLLTTNKSIRFWTPQIGDGSKGSNFRPHTYVHIPLNLDQPDQIWQDNSQDREDFPESTIPQRRAVYGYHHVSIAQPLSEV